MILRCNATDVFLHQVIQSVHLWFELAVWLHILAAAIWVGGIAFLIFIAVPWARTADRRLAAEFISATGKRFRHIGWICFAVFLVTGTFSLWVRGVRAANFLQPEWLQSQYGATVTAKIALFLLIVLVSFVHDFFVGPRASAAMRLEPQSKRTQALRRQASLLGRFSAVLALLTVFVAVMLVRGVPFQ